VESVLITNAQMRGEKRHESPHYSPSNARIAYRITKQTLLQSFNGALWPNIGGSCGASPEAFFWESAMRFSCQDLVSHTAVDQAPNQILFIKVVGEAEFNPACFVQLR
jgi:hypothetical protein